jgi:hypothetical protein
MNSPQGERRRHARLNPENTRVRCGSADAGDSGTNFAKRLLNVGPGGTCIETVGRLRAGVRLDVDLRFDDFGGALRSQAVIVWVSTLKEGGMEVHLAGLRFIGPEFSAAVRQFLKGRPAGEIAAERKDAYRDLKQKAAGAAEGSRRRRPFRTVLLALGALAVLYAGAFAVCVAGGRLEGPGLRFRYTGMWNGSAPQERVLSSVFDPLLKLCRAAGLDWVHDAP